MRGKAGITVFPLQKNGICDIFINRYLSCFGRILHVPRPSAQRR